MYCIEKLPHFLPDILAQSVTPKKCVPLYIYTQTHTHSRTLYTTNGIERALKADKIAIYRINIDLSIYLSKISAPQAS